MTETDEILNNAQVIVNDKRKKQQNETAYVNVKLGTVSSAKMCELQTREYVQN